MHSANKCSNCKRWCNGCQCAGCGSIAVWVVGQAVRLRIQAGQGAPFSAWCLQRGETVMVTRPAEGGYVLVQSMNNQGARGWVAASALTLVSWLVPATSLVTATPTITTTTTTAPVPRVRVAPVLATPTVTTYLPPPSPSESSASSEPTPEDGEILPLESVKQVLTAIKSMY
eukprot:TRINITY_DN874_c0_g1_i3.p1 TRINITY_DN874_c0_g1~~TRINITY_DN874_c0_g1_i3.p1  ORF type:complete len:196 (+),score=38.69 TRINITY_DN874_c0_g1_i3:75-590(+)